MKTTTKLLFALPFLFVAGAGTGFAQSVTGDPATDGGWTSDGLSTSANNIMLRAGNTANFSVDVYSTAFTLASGSPLVGSLPDWNVGDTIVGVGGVFTSTGNSSLTYDTGNGTANLHLVVKYGSPSATWTLPGTALPSGSAGSLTYGGNGAVLLGSTPETIGPSTGLSPTTDAPTEELTVGGQTAVSSIGDDGEVMTSWNGGALTGFESFMDLTLLEATLPSADIAPGDDFVLDLQQGMGVYQDSLGTLPSSLESVAPAAAPDHMTIFADGLFLLLPLGMAALRKSRAA